MASSLITGESRTVWTLPHTISRQAKAPVHRGFAAPQLMRDTTVQFSCNPLGYGTSRHLLPNRRQGDLVSRRADPPSQDRRSLGYLVSSPPLATDHGSRLHQLSCGAACRLSGSHHLDMTRPQRIAVTAFLSALFVPSLFLLPVWCLKSEGMRSLLWDLSSSAPPLVNTVVAGAIPLIVFGVLCSVFAWVVARIWR